MKIKCHYSNSMYIKDIKVNKQLYTEILSLQLVKMIETPKQPIDKKMKSSDFLELRCSEIERQLSPSNEQI